MRYTEISHQTFKVSDFLSWQREGTLELSPSFQRRPVWKPSAKSYLVDTIARNLPVPVIFVRERIDLQLQKARREVVDGQQRLRTLFSFIDPSALPDLNPDRDIFRVSPRHNKEIANKTFGQLTDDVKRRILGYEFPTHVLPSNTEDRDVLAIFARMNSTGIQLNGQELRNAEYFGLFKSDMYDLALEQLDRWREWGIFSEEQIARMAEVELTSDLVMAMLNGLTGKSKTKLNNLYARYDDSYQESPQITARFRRTMDTIEEALGESIGATVYSSEVYFYSLFVFIYDLLYGLNSDLTSSAKVRRPTWDRLRRSLALVSDNFQSGAVPENVRDSIIRASADLGRRRTRHDYLKKIYDESSR